jgi:hypothetical protein
MALAAGFKVVALFGERAIRLRGCKEFAGRQ